jgi:hypothetical protein
MVCPASEPDLPISTATCLIKQNGRGKPRPRCKRQCGCWALGNKVAGSTFTPGPMVEEIATRLMK